ncbi:hypothetical protein [Halorussus salinus]|uniref:hypothetical protein n=1 Tax=Halorussus salinus TaxID=1364935 RepID=UPI00109280F0|nr:hypothetical protein [Halorussus salinus]
MERDYWISELGRLYVRSTEAHEENDKAAIEPLTENFNEVLQNLKEEFPHNSIVNNTDEVEARDGGSSNTGEIFAPSRPDYVSNNRRRTSTQTSDSPSLRRPSALFEIRNRCARMANAIGYDLPEAEENDDENRMVVVKVDNDQSVEQTVSQDVTVESTIELINSLPRSKDEKEEMRELLDKLDEELSGENPDKGRVEKLIQKAKMISEEVAVKMAVIAITSGMTDIVNVL